MNVVHFAHTNIVVRDVEASIAFYEEALGLCVDGDYSLDDGARRLVFLKGSNPDFRLELTWLRGCGAIEIGHPQNHIGVYAEDYCACKQKHAAMNIICKDPAGKDLHFIADPDGYVTEVIRRKNA